MCMSYMVVVYVFILLYISLFNLLVSESRVKVEYVQICTWLAILNVK